jgi:L-threonylcarbamoyladenylate synthase
VSGRIVPDGPEGRAAAIRVLRGGGLVAFPTDTVYGIGAATSIPGGIERMFAAKQRPPDRSIVLLLADAEQAGELAELTPVAMALARAFWPGGLTLVLPARADRPAPVLAIEAAPGSTVTVGLRVPDHDSPRALARALGPLPTSSANRSGQPEASTAAQIAEQLGTALELILDGGPARGGQPSTVVDATGAIARVLRDGAISRQRIADALRVAGLPAPAER